MQLKYYIGLTRNGNAMTFKIFLIQAQKQSVAKLRQAVLLWK